MPIAHARDTSGLVSGRRVMLPRFEKHIKMGPSVGGVPGARKAAASVQVLQGRSRVIYTHSCGLCMTPTGNKTQIDRPHHVFVQPPPARSVQCRRASSLQHFTQMSKRFVSKCAFSALHERTSTRTRTLPRRCAVFPGSATPTSSDSRLISHQTHSDSQQGVIDV